MKIFSLRTKLFPAFIGVRPRLLMLLLFAFAFTGCAEVMDQIDKMANFAKCQSRLASVENTALRRHPPPERQPFRRQPAEPHQAPDGLHLGHPAPGLHAEPGGEEPQLSAGPA